VEEAKLDIHEYQAKEILTNFGVATPHGAVGQQLAQKWCSDCFAVGAEDAEAYGSVPSFVFTAEMCFSIGGLDWYSRRSTVPGLRRDKQELAARTLTPLILVRIQVPQPYTSLI
jgi:hypothetical protein